MNKKTNSGLVMCEPQDSGFGRAQAGSGLPYIRFRASGGFGWYGAKFASDRWVGRQVFMYIQDLKFKGFLFVMCERQASGLQASDGLGPSKIAFRRVGGPRLGLDTSL